MDELCEHDDKKSKEAKKDSKKCETASNRSTNSNDGEPLGLKGFDDLYNDIDVKFILYFTEYGYDTIKEDTEKFEKKFKLTSSWKTTNMTCFDVDFNIVKYKTIGDILEKFLETRLPKYEERRLNILGTLQKAIEELDAKRRFIQAILDDRLVLQKKSDEEIVQGLKECNIPALSNMEKPDEYDSYEYCVKMRIDRVKQSAVIELDKQIAEKQGEIDRLEMETANSLWLSDLEDFEVCWKNMSALRLSDSVSVAKTEGIGKGTKGKKRPVVKK